MEQTLPHTLCSEWLLIAASFPIFGLVRREVVRDLLVRRD